MAQNEYKKDQKAGNVGVVGANGECIDVGPGCDTIYKKGFYQMGFGDRLEVNVGYESSSTITFAKNAFRQAGQTGGGGNTKVIME